MEFTYKPPNSFLIKSLIGLILLLIFILNIRTQNDRFFVLFMMFLCVNAFVYFLFNLFLYLKVVEYKTLKITNESLVLPRRWNKSIQIPFDKIENPIEYNSKDKVIEIIFDNEVYIIEEKWMKLEDFETVKSTLLNISAS